MTWPGLVWSPIDLPYIYLPYIYLPYIGNYKDKLGDDGTKDTRMFCVINKKIGLIKLVSKSVRDEQKEANEKKDKFAAVAAAPTNP